MEILSVMIWPVTIGYFLTLILMLRVAIVVSGVGIITFFCAAFLFDSVKLREMVIIALYFGPFFLAFFVVGGSLGCLARSFAAKREWGYPLILAVALIGSLVYFQAWTQKHKLGLEEEKINVLAFAQTHPKVLQAVGSGQRTIIITTTGSNDPLRYDIGVGNKKVVYAIVDVSRVSGVTKFKLACITYLYHGQRDPNKDDCAQ